MSWLIYIPLIAVGLSLVSLFFRSMAHDREKMKEVEFAIIRKQREVKELQKSKDTKAMMDAQKEMMSMSMQKMKMSMRATIVTLPIFLLIWWFVLGPTLAVGPLVAGDVSEVGTVIRNVDTTPHNINLELVSEDITVSGQNSRKIELDDKGDQGDVKEVWWNVTAQEGSRQYSIKVTTEDNETGEVLNTVEFVSPDGLVAGFSPGEMQEVMHKFEITPRHHTTRINLFGINLDWHMYYIVSFFALAALFYPLTNRVLWGHHKGVKHLEKLDTQKKRAEA